MFSDDYYYFLKSLQPVLYFCLWWVSVDAQNSLSLLLMSERTATIEISSTSQLQKDEDHSHTGWLEQCQPLRKWLCEWPGQQPSWSPVYILTTTESKHTRPVHSSSFSSYFQPSQWVLYGKPQSAVCVQQQNAKIVSEWILDFFGVMGLNLPNPTLYYPAVFHANVMSL